MNEILERWKNAVRESDTKRVRQLFAEFPKLSQHVNDQIFDFDRSAVHCCRENVELIDLLLEHGADLNLKSGWSAGGFGILEGISAEIAQPLIDRGARVDIWAAVCLNDKPVVREILGDNPGLILARGGDGKHPLHDAQDIEMVDFLITCGADVHARCVDHHSTAAQYQVQNRDVLYRLLDHGSEPDVFMAALHNDDNILDGCLLRDPHCCNSRLGKGHWTNQSGGDIYNWTIGHDMTPQQVARDKGHDSLLTRLLEHTSPTSQLMEAIWTADRPSVEQILNENKSLPGDLIQEDREALARAAWWYNPGAVKLMLELGFDTRDKGVHESTPLDRAAFHGYDDIIEMLLAHDSNPPLSVMNEFGSTPLTTCLYGFKHGWKTGHPQNHVRTVELLVAAGSDVVERFLGTGNEEIDNIIGNALKRRSET